MLLTNGKWLRVRAGKVSFSRRMLENYVLISPVTVGAEQVAGWCKPICLAEQKRSPRGRATQAINAKASVPGTKDQRLPLPD